MKSQLKALHGLQQVDLQIAAVTNALQKLDCGAKLKQQLAQAQSVFSSLSAELKKSESELRDSELNLKTIEEKQKSLNNRLYAGGITNPKELSSVEKEIAALDKNRAELDERILGLYDVVERRQADVDKVQSLISAANERLAKITSDYQSKALVLNAQLQKLEEERKIAIQLVENRTLLQRYESIRSRNKDAGMAVVENGKCSGCHIGLPGYTVRLIKEGEQYYTCESCGRILFLKD